MVMHRRPSTNYLLLLFAGVLVVPAATLDRGDARNGPTYRYLVLIEDKIHEVRSIWAINRAYAYASSLKSEV